MHKRLAFFFILIACPVFLTASPAITETNIVLKELSLLRWKNRVVLVWLAQEDTHVLSILDQQAQALNDRDIVWFVLNNKNIRSNYTGEISNVFIDSLQALRSTKNEEKAQEVILIGKDGGIKSRSKELDFKDLYRLIDGMPMRQQERRSRG